MLAHLLLPSPTPQTNLRITLFQKVTVVLLTKKFIVFYETLWFMAVCTTVHNRAILLPWWWRLYCHLKRQQLCVQRHSLTTRKNYVESLKNLFWIIVTKYCFLLWIIWFSQLCSSGSPEIAGVMRSSQHFSSSASTSALLCLPVCVCRCWSRNYSILVTMN